MRNFWVWGMAAILASGACRCAPAQNRRAIEGRENVILDTDIGDDIDDAFALVLALSNPKLNVLGVTTAWGDTDLRARLVTRLLTQTGHSEIPVAAGPKTETNSKFTQRLWAEAMPKPAQGWPDAIDFTLDLIRRNPGQITLIAVAPFSNISALIRKDPATFHKLKRVIVMAGSIRRGYGDLGYLPDRGPESEYNIYADIPDAEKLFASRVPLYVMPLDSTQLEFDEVLRTTLFSRSTPASDALALLYAQWNASTHDPTPVLYDAMAVAVATNPDLCPTRPMRIDIDAKGNTKKISGEPNAHVCLNSSAEKFFDFYMHTVLPVAPKPSLPSR